MTSLSNPGEVQRIVLEVVERAVEQAGGNRAISGRTVLGQDLGLSSLAVVEIISEISEHLRVGDDAPVAVTDVRTVGDIAALFAAPAVPEDSGVAGTSVDRELQDSLSRSMDRRRRRGR